MNSFGPSPVFLFVVFFLRELINRREVHELGISSCSLVGEALTRGQVRSSSFDNQQYLSRFVTVMFATANLHTVNSNQTTAQNWFI